MLFFFLMIRRPPRSTLSSSSAASDVYKRQVSDVMPSGVEGLINPLHELVLVGLGMPLLDNLDLDELAKFAQKTNKWEFLFVGAPLRVRGGTGSPMNPIAVF